MPGSAERPANGSGRAEAVRRRSERRRAAAPGPWGAALGRLAAIGAGALLLLAVPMPFLNEWLPVRDVLVVALAVLLAGKCLFDTLFYDRFWP